jgi:hypothetical protein
MKKAGLQGWPVLQDFLCKEMSGKLVEIQGGPVF